MSNLNIYIIYHKNVYQENTAGFADLHNFTWVAVNESILKINDDWIPKERLLKEWTMPVYNPLMQMSNFYQNSVFFHLYWNPELLSSKYVGFAQYDMGFDVSALQGIINGIGAGDVGDKIFGAYPFEFNAIYGVLGPAEWDECFMKPYNNYYSTMHKIGDISDVPLLLLHTFIMPKWFFLHMMGFVDKMYVGVLRSLGWNTRHLAGTLERVFALCIAFGIKENKFRMIGLWPGVNHIDSQHSGDSLRGISVGKGSG
jgi:hypothetical protein